MGGEGGGAFQRRRRAWPQGAAGSVRKFLHRVGFGLDDLPGSKVLRFSCIKKKHQAIPVGPAAGAWQYE